MQSSQLAISSYYQPVILDAEIISDEHLQNSQNNLNQFRNVLFNINEIDTDNAITLWLSQFASRNTQKQYERAVNKFFQWYPVKLGNITPQIFGNYQRWIKFVYTSKNTIAIKINAIKSFLKYCVANRFIAFDPSSAAKSLAPQKAVEERILKDNQVAIILGISHKLPPVFGLLVRFLSETGCRISEALSATFTNANGSDNYREMSNGNIALFVLGKGDKKREICVSSSLFSAIRKLSGNKNLFNGIKGEQLNYSTAYNYLKKSLKLAKLNTKISFHWFRHFAAKSMLEAGHDIKKVSRSLGHSNITTTSVYLDLLQDDIAINSKF